VCCIIAVAGVLIARRTTHAIDEDDVAGEVVTALAVPMGAVFKPDESWVAERMSTFQVKGSVNPMADARPVVRARPLSRRIADLVSGAFRDRTTSHESTAPSMLTVEEETSARSAATGTRNVDDLFHAGEEETAPVATQSRVKGRKLTYTQPFTEPAATIEMMTYNPEASSQPPQGRASKAQLLITAGDVISL